MNLHAQIGVGRGAEEPPRDAQRVPARGVQERGALHGSGFRVQGQGCRVEGAGLRVQGAGWRVYECAVLGGDSGGRAVVIPALRGVLFRFGSGTVFLP